MSDGLTLCFFRPFQGIYNRAAGSIEALAGLVIGSLVVYATLHSRMTSGVVGRAQRMVEQQKGQLEASFRETYEAKLGEWKATTLAQAIEENRADAVDASRAVLKGKIAEQMAPSLPGFLAKYNRADARFIGSPIDYLIFRNTGSRQ